MRLVLVCAASVLLAACASNTDGRGEMPQPALPSSSTSTRTPTPATSTTKPPAPTKAPAAGAPIADVIRWIEAGVPADVAGFHTATRDGVATQLGDDVAFVTPSGKTTCMTDSRFAGALACLVNLVDPPPKPADVYGQWQGGWVDFEGATTEVGSAHGDPGRFGAGTGAQLPYGQTLAFGDYRCRADESGIYCVNYAHQSAVKFVDSGIETFGCLAPVAPPTDIGKKFSC